MNSSPVKKRVYSKSPQSIKFSASFEPNDKVNNPESFSEFSILKKESFTKSITEFQVSSKFLLVITEFLNLVSSIFGGTYLPTFSLILFFYYFQSRVDEVLKTKATKILTYKEFCEILQKMKK